MIEQAREVIREALKGSEHPAVLMSFGKDSSLLLHLAREVRPDINVIWFRSGGNSFAKQMIMEMELEVWSWEPSDVYVLPNGDGLSLVREQAFGLQRFPVVMDIEDGKQCIGEILPERTLSLFPHFDYLLLGYKDIDFHAVLGGSGFCPPNGWTLGKAKVFAPLREMTDDQVWAAIKELGVIYDTQRYDHNGTDPDSISACTRCLQNKGVVFCPKEKRMIPSVVWDKEINLHLFQGRFGFAKEAA